MNDAKKDDGQKLHVLFYASTRSHLRLEQVQATVIAHIHSLAASDLWSGFVGGHRRGEVAIIAMLIWRHLRLRIVENAKVAYVPLDDARCRKIAWPVDVGNPLGLSCPTITSSCLSTMLSRCNRCWPLLATMTSSCLLTMLSSRFVCVLASWSAILCAEDWRRHILSQLH